jgi:hypothetical protein
MAVILANCALTARPVEHPRSRDARGKPVVGTAQPTGAVRGPYPGAVTPPDGDLGPEGGGWRIRADLRLGPLNTGDQLTTDDGRVFYVKESHEVKVPGVPDVDFIRVVANIDPPPKV